MIINTSVQQNNFLYIQQSIRQIQGVVVTGLDEYLDDADITTDDIANLINAFTLIATWKDDIDISDSNEIFRTRELTLIRRILQSNLDNLSPELIQKLTNRIKELIHN